MSEFSSYELGTSIKNNIHQTITRTNKIEVINKLLNKVQLKIKTKTPKEIIDQGWHQIGFRSQNVFLGFGFIKEKRNRIIRPKQY